MYIRTKDGVYEVEAETDTFYYTNIAREIGVIKTNRVREADTIEELCDRYVVMDKETKEVVNIVTFLAYAKLWSSCKYDIFGAVFCEWGLKYVAKMDSEGKLVLI